MEEGQEKKYSAALLIPKKDKRTIAACEAAIKEAFESGKAKFGGKLPPKWKSPLRDGDEERPEDEVYAGHMFVNANSTNRPGLIDADKNEIMDKEEFYSGCYGRASVNFYPFNVSGNKGVACGLNGIMKLEDGERLGGGGFDASDFDEGDDPLT